MSVHTPTQLIILAATSLYQAALTALLGEQPDIVIAGAVGEVSEVPPIIQSNQPTTLLIDLPPPLSPLARQLTTDVPDLGLLFLVESYELDHILPLLRSGATGCISRDETVADLARALIAGWRPTCAIFLAS